MSLLWYMNIDAGNPIPQCSTEVHRCLQAKCVTQMPPILGEYLQRVSYFICSNFSLCCICYCKITHVFVLVYLWSFNLPLLPVVRILFHKFSSMSVPACCKWTVRLLVERVAVLHPIQHHESNLEKFRKTNTIKL